MKVVHSIALLALLSATNAQYGGYEDGNEDNYTPQYYYGEEGEGAYEPEDENEEEGVYEPYTPDAVVPGVAEAYCLGTCPPTARCQDIATGNCLAPNSPLGRSLSESGKTTDYKDDEKYANEACPAGTIDVACNRLGSTVALWVGFGLLFAPALYFYWLTFYDHKTSSHENAFGTTVWADVQQARFLCFAIVFIASLAYLTMALGYGNTVNCTDGREFFYVRYIDWVFTTPIMLYKLTSRTDLAHHETAFILFMDVLMIVSGLIGAFATGTAKWIFFAFSMFTFLPILVYLWLMHGRVLRKAHFGEVWNRAAWLLFIIWIQYPIVWVLSEGTGTICSSAEAIWYTVLDVLAKALFGFLLIGDKANFDTAMASQTSNHQGSNNGYHSGSGQIGGSSSHNTGNHNPAGSFY